MKAFITILFCALANLAWGYNQGDILFQESKSSQSKYIKFATLSRYTHCGVIYKKGGKEYVLEASAKVKLTPVDKWIARGVGKKVKVRRCNKKDFKINLHKYLGKSYDTSFSWDNRRMYCSELVYKIYLDNGIELCKLKKVRDYWTFPFRSYLKKRGIRMEEPVVAPCDLM